MSQIDSKPPGISTNLKKYRMNLHSHTLYVYICIYMYIFDSIPGPIPCRCPGAVAVRFRRCCAASGAPHGMHGTAAGTACSIRLGLYALCLGL